MSAPDLPVIQWRKSSFSGHDGGQCVEVAAPCVNATPNPGPAGDA